MTAALLLWWRAHWKAALPALGVGVAAGWLAHRPAAPKVHEVVDEHATADQHADVDTTVHAGPEKVTIEDFGWAPPVLPASHGPEGELVPAACRIVNSPERVVQRRVVIERGQVVTETHATTEEHQEQDRHLDLTVTPQSAQAGWAVQVGFEDVLHAKTLRLAARRRLVGPFWAELSALPVSRSLGLAVAVEW